MQNPFGYYRRKRISEERAARREVRHRLKEADRRAREGQARWRQRLRWARRYDSMVVSVLRPVQRAFFSGEALERITDTEAGTIEWRIGHWEADPAGWSSAPQRFASRTWVRLLFDEQEAPCGFLCWNEARGEVQTRLDEAGLAQALRRLHLPESILAATGGAAQPARAPAAGSGVVNRILNECAREIQASIEGEVRLDPVSRLLYSTDASIYRFDPLGVVFPRSQGDLAETVRIASAYRVPVLARGAGSSLAGQAIGPALILDCSRYLDRIHEIDYQKRTAVVEPGVVLNQLNRELERYGLRFGPDPASAERATVGGSIANNATGSHSILYGMAADHLVAATVILADGSPAAFSTLTLEEARRRAGLDGPPPGERPYASEHKLEADIYRAALEIREHYGDTIRRDWPRTWRCASGYNLHYLLPWSPTRPPFWRPDTNPARVEGAVSEGYPPIPPGYLNLAPLLAGSEGTLAVMSQLTLNLVPLPKQTLLAVLPFSSVAQACTAVPQILNETQPSAVELIPRSIVERARAIPAYARLAGFWDRLKQNGEPEALLAVEFSGDDPAELRLQAERLGSGAYIAATKEEQDQVWRVRKAGLGLLLSKPGDEKPAAFIEDLSVPVDRLDEFVAGMERLLRENGSSADFYAHASAGCLHIRPLVNLKTGEGVRRMREIAAGAVELTLSLSGAVSGEHGDGLARSQWLEKMFGAQVVEAFRLLKQAADPQGILNPGKILDAPPMHTHLRYGEGYRTQEWQTQLDFSAEGGLSGAVEQCNGAGVCRKSEGVMCPSFQATREEKHSTRGRANLLRAMLSGQFPAGMKSEKAVYEALELCLACKGCKAECPSGVDMAKLKYEFMDRYYRRHRRPLRDYLFAYIDRLAWWGSPLAPLLNPMLNARLAGGLVRRFLGLAAARPFPQFQRENLFELARQQRPRPAMTVAPAGEQALFLADAFSVYFYPGQGLAALGLLARAGVQATLLRTIGAGRTLISKSFLDAARRHALKLLDEIDRLDPHGTLPVVGIEPSEILSLRDEYPDLLPGDPRVKRLAKRAWMLDEYLLRPGSGGTPRMAALLPAQKISPLHFPSAPQPPQPLVYLHGHCYQKAQPPSEDGEPCGVQATVSMLETAGYRVRLVEAGCCGMAGAFGYEAEHFEISLKAGEKLLETVRQAPPGALIAASGVSCKAQIEDGAGRKTLHPVELVERITR